MDRKWFGKLVDFTLQFLPRPDDLVAPLMLVWQFVQDAILMGGAVVAFLSDYD